MSIPQISVFIPNTKGALAEVCRTLADNGMNLRALSIADTRDFGILRIIVEDAEGACELLRQNGYTCKVTPVLAVRIEDKPGGMAEVMELIAEHGISAEYAYAFVSHKPGEAYMVFRVIGSDARHILIDAGLHVAEKEELFE